VPPALPKGRSFFRISQKLQPIHTHPIPFHLQTGWHIPAKPFARPIQNLLGLGSITDFPSIVGPGHRKTSFFQFSVKIFTFKALKACLLPDKNKRSGLTQPENLIEF
jgi:hypothetical protein